MKIKVTTLFLFLSFCITLNATNGIPKHPAFLELIENSKPISFNEIFFADNENEVVFIDFEPIADDLLMLNIFRDGKLMMEDDITDLPDNSIYEINTQVIRKGTYTVELVTSSDIKIRKEISIK